MTMTPIAPLLVAVPLLGAALLAGARDKLPRLAADLLTTALALANLVLSVLLLHRAWMGTVVYWFGNWYPRGRMAIGISFVVDPAGAGLAVLAALLTVLATTFSWRYVDAGDKHYHPLMLVFLAAMSGFALTGDIFNLFVFFELMSTAAFALCGLKTGEPQPLAGAFNFAVTNTIAAFLVLTGIALLYAVTGALNLAQIGAALGTRHDRLVLAAFVFIASGFLVKAAMVPFHFWLADAHSVAPTPVCVLFSGLMVELGLFGIVRVYSTVFSNSFHAHTASLHGIFAAMGAFTAVMGGLMCFAQHHLKRLLAFSTVSHMGLMMLGFAGITQEAMSGLFVYIMSHALIKGGLFLTAGILLHRLRTMSEPLLHARGKPLHWTAVLWFAGGLALAGAPPFGLMLGDALIATAHPWYKWIFLIAGALTSAAVLRCGMRVFGGWGDAGPMDEPAKLDEKPETTEASRKIFAFLFLPPAFCICAAAVVPWIPRLREVCQQAAARLMDQGAYAQTVFHTGPGRAMVEAVKPLPLLDPVEHGLLTAGLAIALALLAVFHERVPRPARIPSHMEGSMHALRALQSGHPGDYVAWLTAGTALVGGAVFLFTH